MTEFLHGVRTVEVDTDSRTIRTGRSSVIHLIGTAPNVEDNAFAVNTPVLVTDELAGKLGDGGTLRSALNGIYDQARAIVIITRIEEAADELTTLGNVVGDVTAKTGVYSALAAESVTGLKPRIIIAPGFTHQRPGGNANPVVAALKAVTERLRAVAFVDGPGTDDPAALAAAAETGSNRIYLTDPFALVFDGGNGSVPQPMSARLAGLQAHTDATNGFWWSLSNKPINGIIGVSRPIEFGGGDSASQDAILNGGNVGTTIMRDGYRAWGNRATDGTFLSVRRTIDIVTDALDDSFIQWAIDRPINGNTVVEIESAANSYLRTLKGLGAILGGQVTLNKEINTQETLADGQMFFDLVIEPPAPLEGLTLRVSRDQGYYSEIFNLDETA